MNKHRIAYGAALSAALLLSSACATADPFARHSRTADLKAAAVDPAAVCDVEVQNATGQLVHASMVFEGGENRSLGLITAGRSVRLPVACRVGRVTAEAISQDWGDSGGRHFRAAARLDPLGATLLRLSATSQIAY